VCMKNQRNAAAAWLLALGLTVFFQACKPKEPEVIDPDVSAIERITLPTVTPTQPQAVSSTVGVVAPSAAATGSVTNLIGGTVTPAVTQAQANTQTALAGNSPAPIVSGFTPAVISSFVSSGTLPASLQAQMTALVNNPAFAAYLPTVTRPTVNGSTVSIAKPVVDGESLLDVPQSFAMAAVANDPCIEKAKAAREQVLSTLTAGRNQQETAVNASFTARQTAIATGATACAASVTQATTTRNTEATVALNAALTGIGNLVTAGTINAATADLLRVFVYGNFFASINAIRTLDAAEKNRCERVRTLELAEANRVRTVDLAAIRSAFETASASVIAEFVKVESICHNQGSGN